MSVKLTCYKTRNALNPRIEGISLKIGEVKKIIILFSQQQEVLEKHWLSTNKESKNINKNVLTKRGKTD